MNESRHDALMQSLDTLGATIDRLPDKSAVAQEAVDRVLSALRSQVVEQLPDAPLLLKEDVLALIDEIQQKTEDKT